ncbi:MAG: Kazal-type serine protease inhibitor domain-containing protein [Bacteroidia bacterium]
MKHIMYYPLLAAGLLLACNKTIDPVLTPDFSQCDCPANEYHFVCGEDGRNYVSECFADCMGVNVAADSNCAEIFFDPNDTLTWPIQLVCIPIGNASSPQWVKNFTDGSSLWQEVNGNYFRGYELPCVCLPPSTRIATPTGEIALGNISEGDLVWTLDERGQKTAVPVLLRSRVSVSPDHQLLHIVLADGRTLDVSPGHPDMRGLPLVSSKPGDLLDGSEIISATLIPYTGSETMDILPGGKTGFYLANGIMIGSTLKDLIPQPRNKANSVAP